MMVRETRNRAFVLSQDIRQDAAVLSKLLSDPEKADQVNMERLTEVFADIEASTLNLRKALGEVYGE